MPSQNQSISHARFKGARFCRIGASGTQVASVMHLSAFVRTSLSSAPQRTAPPSYTFVVFAPFFLLFYCSNIICFCKLHIFRMYFKWCPCPLVGIVATFANFFACFDCRVRANFDWDILLWALLLPPQTHTRAFASGRNRRSKQIALFVYYALAFRVIGIMFATNMQFLRIIYKIFFSVSFSTSAILLFGLSIIRAVPESIIDSCQ